MRPLSGVPGSGDTLCFGQSAQACFESLGSLEAQQDFQWWLELLLCTIIDRMMHFREVFMADNGFITYGV